MAEEDLLTKYYLAQAQAGSGMGGFYSGPIYQRGHGIGSFLSGLFRGVLPILKRGSIAVGKEILNSGANFINDLENNVDAKVALKKRTKEGYSNLKEKMKEKMMSGDGYKTRKHNKKQQSRVNRRGVKTSGKHIVKRKKSVKKKSLKQKVYDIFSKVKK